MLPLQYLCKGGELSILNKSWYFLIFIGYKRHVGRQFSYKSNSVIDFWLCFLFNNGSAAHNTVVDERQHHFTVKTDSIPL